MKKNIGPAIIFLLIVLPTLLVILFGTGCDIDFVTDTVYVPSPIYYIEEPCCNDYIEIWIY